MLHDDLFTLGRARSCYKGCGCVCTWIDQCRVYPNWVRNDDAVLLLEYDACKVPVLLPLSETGRLQYGECPAKFALKSVNRFRSYDARDLFVMASFWAMSILYAPFLENFDDIFASTLQERKDVQCQNCEDKSKSLTPMAFTEVNENDIN